MVRLNFSEEPCADLFCGAGGTSHGAERSKRAKLVFALNHWQTAIDTHSANFPHAQHINSRLADVHPSDCKLKFGILFASPECTHHSNARGGRPMCDQSRAGALDILKWVRHHKPGWVVIENVREYVGWGPLDENGRPDKNRKGEFFNEFIAALRSLGYAVEYELLNAADFGAATSRVRLIIIARRGKKKSPIFPEPTHSSFKGGVLVNPKLKQWRPAYDVIDWTQSCPSIFSRRKQLADKTLRRIEMGLKKFVGPFVGQFQGPGMGDPSYKGVFDPSRPMPTILARNNHGIVIPYTIKYHGGNKAGRDGTERQYSPGEPLQTLDTQNRFGLAAAFLVRFRNNMDASDLADPVGTITAGGGHHGLAVHYIIPNFGEREGQAPRTHDIQNGMPAVTSHGAGGLAVPFIADVNHGDDGGSGNRVYDASNPLGSVTTKRGKSLICPLICPEMAPHVPDWRAIQEWESEGGSIGEPFTDAMISLLETMRDCGVWDIGFRMFMNEELSLAQGFDPDYHFSGNKAEVTKQIGNSVSPDLAEAITRALTA